MLFGFIDELTSSWQFWVIAVFVGLGWLMEKAAKDPAVQRGAANWFFGLFK